MNARQQVTINELKQRAEAGDANAQYALAGLLSSAQAKAESDQWLQAAADQGHGDALYTLATRRLDSAGAEEAARQLAQAAQAGSTPAQRLLGVLYAEGFGVDQDWEAAVSHVMETARAGNPPAMREIAMLLFAVDPDDRDGAMLIARAAPRDPCAAAVAIRRAVGKRKHAHAATASKALRDLSEGRYPNIATLNAAMQDARPEETAPAEEPDWERVASIVSREPAPPDIAPEQICDAPSVRAYRGAFTPEECEYVIASSVRLLAPSMIIDPETGESRKDEYRTSLTAVMAPADLDLALVMINRRLAALAGQPSENGEMLGVLLYGPGHEYRPHCDWLSSGPEYDRNGQRTATALLYLNAEYEGGETHFLSPDLRVKGAAGDILVFHNTLPDGAPDEASRHAGLPVTDGAKWLGSKWFREKKYNL